MVLPDPDSKVYRKIPDITYPHIIEEPFPAFIYPTLSEKALKQFNEEAMAFVNSPKYEWDEFTIYPMENK